MDNVFQPNGLVVGVDPSQESQHATEWAAERAAASALPLHLVAAHSPETEEGWDHDHQSTRPSRELNLHRLDRLRERLLSRHPGLHVSIASTGRLPASALVLAGSRSRTVVLGSHGESLVRWSLGSTAHQVAVHASCSVAVVRPEREEPLHRVLVGVDAPHDLAGLRWALHEADRTRSEAYVVHVADRETTRAESARHRIEQDLDAAVRVAAATYPEVKVRAEVLTGHAVRTLLHESADHDLVVLGARGTGGFPGLTLGHVAGAVLQRADCTVVIAR